MIEHKAKCDICGFVGVDFDTVWDRGDGIVRCKVCHGYKKWDSTAPSDTPELEEWLEVLQIASRKEGADQEVGDV